MKDDIRQGQLLMLIIVVISGGKVLSLPGIMAGMAGRDSWIAMCLLFAADLVCLACMLWALGINKEGLDINEIFCRSLTKPVAKALFLLYAVFFFTRVTGGMLDVLELVSSSLSVVTNWVAFALPTLAVITFMAVKGLRNIGRVTQIFFIFIFASVLLILLLSVGHTDFGGLKPTLSGGFGKVIDCAFNVNFWFSDGVFLLFLAGRVKTGKDFYAKTKGPVQLGAALTVCLDVVFLALFGNLARYAVSALSKVSGFNITGSVYGRLDWVFIVLWMSSVIIKTTLFLWAASAGVEYALGISGRNARLAVFCVMSLIIIVLPLVFPMEEVVRRVFCEGWGKYVTAAAQYAVPLVSPLLVYAANKKTARAKTPETAEDGV